MQTLINPEPTERAISISEPKSAPFVKIAPENICLEISGRMFVLNAMDEEDSKQWASARYWFHWRQLVCFKGIKATVVGAVPAKRSKKSDKERDQRLDELTGEWITLGNTLVACALGLLDDPDNGAGFVKTLSFGEKMKIITHQDQLNGLNILTEIAHMDNVRAAHERLQKAKEKIQDIEDDENEETSSGAPNVAKNFKTKKKRKK